jgi:hypothetical protein
MAVSVGGRPSRLRAALAAILTILILVPAGVLFLRVWQDIEDERDGARLEQLGVEYLTALSPLISALAEAQSSALQGVSAAPASLTAAMTRVAAVDQRLGAELGTRERWAGLRDKIDALPSVNGPPTCVRRCTAPCWTTRASTAIRTMTCRTCRPPSVSTCRPPWSR